MRRISQLILVLVGAFVVLVAGTLIVRGRAVRVDPGEKLTSKADYRIKEVHLQEETGKVHWRLTAELAEIFEDEGRTRLRQPVVLIQEPGRSWTLRGDEGEVLQRTKDVEMRGNVVVMSDDGIRLETSMLRWHGQTQRLATDSPVVLRREGTVVRGTGLEVDMDAEHAVVRGRVQAVIAREGRW